MSDKPLDPFDRWFAEKRGRVMWRIKDDRRAVAMYSIGAHKFIHVAEANGMGIGTWDVYVPTWTIDAEIGPSLNALDRYLGTEADLDGVRKKLSHHRGGTK